MYDYITFVSQYDEKNFRAMSRRKKSIGNIKTRQIYSGNELKEVSILHQLTLRMLGPGLLYYRNRENSIVRFQNFMFSP